MLFHAKIPHSRGSLYRLESNWKCSKFDDDFMLGKLYKNSVKTIDFCPISLAYYAR
jgi:hypothetical protein